MSTEEPQPGPYAIQFTPAAARQVSKIDPGIRRRVLAGIEQLGTQPRPAGVRALVGRPGQLRLRVGDYRIIYTVRDVELVVLVIATAHRARSTATAKSKE